MASGAIIANGAVWISAIVAANVYPRGWFVLALMALGISSTAIALVAVS
jgi:cytochrome c biogenesis protein ResB